MKYWLVNKWLGKVWILATLIPFPFHSFWHSCQGSKWYIPNNIPHHLKWGIITIPHLPLLLIKHFWLCNRERYFLLFILTRNQNQWQFQYIYFAKRQLSWLFLPISSILLFYPIINIIIWGRWEYPFIWIRGKKIC